MNPIFEVLVGYGFGGVVAGLVVWLLTKNYLPAYLSEKGRNVAQKEDIQELTRLVETVKTGNQVLLEGVRASHQLRLAAVDRRLEAHQEAYALWTKLVNSSHQAGWQAAIAECQAWWADNCLYLEPDAREAFSDAYWNSGIMLHQLQSGGPIPATRGDWSKISGAGERLARAVALPGLTMAEQAGVQDKARD